MKTTTFIDAFEAANDVFSALLSKTEKRKGKAKQLPLFDGSVSCLPLHFFHIPQNVLSVERLDAVSLPRVVGNGAFDGSPFATDGNPGQVSSLVGSAAPAKGESVADLAGAAQSAPHGNHGDKPTFDLPSVSMGAL